MDIKQLLKEQAENAPKAQWTFLAMAANDMFPEKVFIHESVWGPWLVKIREGERKDEEYLESRGKELEALSETLLGKQFNIDPGEMLANEEYRSSTVTNNMYAALIVAIWSKCEQTLLKVSGLCAKHLDCDKPLFRYDEQKKFFKKLGIRFSALPGVLAVNGTRLLNNSYKHAGGYCSQKSYHQITAQTANSWKIKAKAKIDYSSLPVEDILSGCHEFFTRLIAVAQNAVETKKSKPPAPSWLRWLRWARKRIGI